MHHDTTASGPGSPPGRTATSFPAFERTADGSSTEARWLQRRASTGELVRVRRGVYVHRAVWDGADAGERHRLLVLAALPDIPADAEISHLSAAALLRWPHIGRWPSRVHLFAAGRPRDTVNATFTIHGGRRTGDPPGNAAADRRVRLVRPAWNLIQLARRLPFAEAVVILDHALRTRVVSRRELEDELALIRGHKGFRLAERAVGFADERRESVGESFCAAVLDEIGAPTPELQRTFLLPSGRRARVDFWFPEQGVVLEFDGVGKYSDPAMLGGRTTAEAHLDEKRREDELRSLPEIRDFVRAGMGDVRVRERLRRKLIAKGVPCPGRRARGAA